MTKCLLIAVLVTACSTETPETDDSPEIVTEALHCNPNLANCNACFSASDPFQSCASPTPVCCFAAAGNHPGTCAADTSSCTYGAESCDGKEECPSGQGCYANEVTTSSWTIACSATPPTGGLATYTMCHPGLSGQCPIGKSCVGTTAAGVTGLPADLYICH